jgi:carboxylesterase type B
MEKPLRRGLALCLVVAASATTASTRTVTIDTGMISSVTVDGIDIFKFIPFAAPPGRHAAMAPAASRTSMARRQKRR